MQIYIYLAWNAQVENVSRLVHHSVPCPGNPNFSLTFPMPPKKEEVYHIKGVFNNRGVGRPKP